MSKGLIITLSILAIVAFGIVSLVGGAIGYSNQEIKLKNQTNAQGQVVAAKFDNMWKTISQMGQVEAKYRESFSNIMTEIAAGRKTQGEMFKWITESNPTLSVEATKNLMTAVEAQRMTFTVEQQKWVDFAREHNNLVEMFPGSLYNIIFQRDLITPKLILSARTDEAVKTGQDNDVKVY